MERSSADQEEGRSREGSRGFFSVCRAWHGSMRRSTGHRPFSPSAASQIDDGDIKGKIDSGRNQICFLSILFCINIPHRVLRSHKFLISINDRICKLFGSATLMDEQETVVRAHIWIELPPKGTYGGAGGEK